MLLVNVWDQSIDEPSRQQFITVLIRKWLVASLGTDGSCLLYESGPPFSILEHLCLFQIKFTFYSSLLHKNNMSYYLFVYN
jgi:hypothetical protein